MEKYPGDVPGDSTALPLPPRPRAGRPALSESRREAARLEIALATVRLFQDKGIQATSAGEVAHSLGISTRTLWRYFPTKESFVRPLLTHSFDRLLAHLRNWPVDRPLAEAVGVIGASAGSGLSHVRTVVRMTRTEPALRSVWLGVADGFTRALADVVAERDGVAADSLTAGVRASALGGAMVAAVEHWAWEEPSAQGATLAEVIRDAVELAGAGLHGERESGKPR